MLTLLPKPCCSHAVERAQQTLPAVNGSRKLAAQRVGISGRTLRYKLQQYRLAAEAHEKPSQTNG